MAAHAVVRTDNLLGTDARSMLRSFKYVVTGESGDVATAIENGNVVKLTDLMTGEREIFKAVTPAANTALEDIVLVDGVELMYDERKHNLDEFINEAGRATRGYCLHHNDLFSVTAEALANASPDVGQIIELAASTKWNNVSSATEGSTVIGKIIAKEVTRRYTYYVIQVD